MAEPEVHESDEIQNKIYRNVEFYQVVWTESPFTENNIIQTTRKKI